MSSQSLKKEAAMPNPFWKRALWFGLLWCVGVACVGIVSYTIRWMIL